MRTENGMTLPTVLVIGLLAALFGAALMSTVLPSYERMNRSRSELFQRTLCETTLDWAVQSLNSPNSSLDSGDALNGTRTTSIPSDIISDSGLAASGTITVTSKQPQAGRSYLYQESLNYYPNPAQQTNGITRTLWRVVDVSVQFGTRTRNLRAILKPVMTNSAVQIDAGLRARGTISGPQNGQINAYDSGDSVNPATFSSFGGDLKSNGMINVGNSVVSGNAVSYHAGPGPSIVGGPSARVTGKARGNSTITITDAQVDGNNPPSGPPPSSPEQLHLPNKRMASMSMAPMVFPPVPAHPVGAHQLPPIGNGQSLAPGDYYTTAITLSGTGNLTTHGTVDHPVRIWVEGSGATIALGGTGINNPDGHPAALEIFYAGNQNIAVSGNAQFKGVLYAPNASVSLAGNGQYYGALTANSISLNTGGSGGGFHFDRSLTNLNLVGNMTFSRYIVVAWQEV